MKKLITILTLFITTSAFAQTVEKVTDESYAKQQEIVVNCNETFQRKASIEARIAGAQTELEEVEAEIEAAQAVGSCLSE